MKNRIFTLLILLVCTSPLLADFHSKEELQQEVCTMLPSLPGWCSKEKALNFIDLVLEIKPDTCVEIGVFGGSSLFPVASALKFLGKGDVIGIDPWDRLEAIKYLDPVKDRANLEWWSSINLDYIYQQYLGMLKRYGLEKYTKTIKAPSRKAVLLLDTIDILHIDGNHEESVIENDVTIFLPKVRSGGYIWLNDSLWEEAQSSIDILLKSCDVVKLIDNGNCILFKKR